MGEKIQWLKLEPVTGKAKEEFLDPSSSLMLRAETLGRLAQTMGVEIWPDENVIALQDGQRTPALEAWVLANGFKFVEKSWSEDLRGNLMME